jgi:hypothetical protein
LNNLSDSIYSAFDVKETHESFTSILPKQIYTSFNYKVGIKSKVGATVHLRETPSKNIIGYHVNYTSSVKDWFNYSIGYSSINLSHGNLGIAFAINIKAGQMYFASDNIIGLINYRNSNVVGLRAGFNFIFAGKSDSKKTSIPVNNPEVIQNKNSASEE